MTMIQDLRSASFDIALILMAMERRKRKPKPLLPKRKKEAAETISACFMDLTLIQPMSARP